MNILSFFFGPFAVWAPPVFIGVIYLLIIARYFLRGTEATTTRLAQVLKINFFTESRLIYGLLAGTLLFNLFLTGAQYYVWTVSALGRFFLPPYQPMSYFLRYVFLHFWLAGILSLAAAAIFYAVLKAVNKYRPGALNHAEINLGFLVCLLVGWPRTLILIPMFFSVMFLTLVSRPLIFKLRRPSAIGTTGPLILAAFLTLIFGYYLINLFGWSALII